ncbi:FAD-dependent oxidoreductase [Novibacillus thermophilus]|uniref:Pyridine nucleotide-disulfide oxidoreductase n=1 Tax=Novibacillus thermophilus TaxID=1471761 RepID=A0A1U9K915_9BACL|nr:FAD-dependent oxidoreductase [Novibacillus thermophilus]AQS56506.1 pyridine nucleotide-disulfide oxidoreductase [Novibacillus thermophilus]
MRYDIAIVGAGPAGASAGLFAAKAGKKTIMFDHGKSVTKRAWIQNHYGVKDIDGPDLIRVGQEQATQFGAELKQEEVTNIVKTDSGFSLETENGTYEAKYVILATGVTVDLAEKIGVATKPGSEPRIKKVLDLDDKGETSIKGIWGAGTVADVSMHTIITAGDGAKVAINIISELNQERYVDHDFK